MPHSTITTAEQLLSLHEPGFCHELVRGELRRMSPAGYWHGAIVGRVARLVGLHVDEGQLGETFGAETGFVLARSPDTVRAPDVSYVRRERLPRPFAAGYFPGPPDLAVEVVSPSDTSTEVHEKALFWLEHGARLVWVVDPKPQRVTVYRSKDDVVEFGIGNDVDGGDVLPGFSVSVLELFPPAAG